MILFLLIQAGYWILLKPNNHIPCPCLTMEDVGHHLWTTSQKPSHPGDLFIGEQFLILTFQTGTCFLLLVDQHQSSHPTTQNIWKAYLQFLLISSAKINMQWRPAVLPVLYHKACLRCRASLSDKNQTEETTKTEKENFPFPSLCSKQLFPFDHLF